MFFSTSRLRRRFNSYKSSWKGDERWRGGGDLITSIIFESANIIRDRNNSGFESHNEYNAKLWRIIWERFEVGSLLSEPISPQQGKTPLLVFISNMLLGWLNPRCLSKHFTAGIFLYQRWFLIRLTPHPKHIRSLSLHGARALVDAFKSYCRENAILW